MEGIPLPPSLVLVLTSIIAISPFQIVDGMLQYRFDCGSGEGLARVNKMLINDGYWHNVLVERISRSVRIVIDDKHIAEGSAPGTNDVLNLDSNIVYFGGEVHMTHGYPDVKNGYVGCMKSIKIDNVELPLTGSSSVGVVQKVYDVENHCRGIYVPGECRRL